MCCAKGSKVNTRLILPLLFSPRGVCAVLDWLGAPLRKPEAVRWVGPRDALARFDAGVASTLWCGIWEMTSYWMRAPRHRCQFFGRAVCPTCQARGDFA